VSNSFKVTGIWILSLGLIVASTGCAASTEDGADSESSEVRTASCPATLDLAFEKPSVFPKTPTRHGDGSPLSATEVARLADAMTEARALPGMSLALKLEEKASGRCYYRAEGFGKRATFRTKSGKNILDVHDGSFRMYLFPTSYSSEGLAFDMTKDVTLFANVPASGPFSDGASSNIEIGSTKLAQAQSADQKFIGELADAVGEYFDYESSSYASNVQPTSLAKLPEAVRARAESLLADEREWVLAGGHGGDAEINEEEIFAILKDGRTVGFVVALNDLISDPLFDGAGIRLFFDVEGHLVTEVRWTG
jgi:hypothetical protein